MDKSKALLLAIKNQIAMASTYNLPDYVMTLEGIDDTLAQLSTRGIVFTKKSISKMVGFNPWEFRRNEEARIERANRLIDDIQAGKKQKPSVSLSNTLRGLFGKHNEIAEKTALLVEIVGECLLLIIEEEESHTSTPEEFEFYFDLKLELQEILEPMPFGDKK